MPIIIIAFIVGVIFGEVVHFLLRPSLFGTLHVIVSEEKNTYRIEVDNLDELPKQKKIYLNVKIDSNDITNQAPK